MLNFSRVFLLIECFRREIIIGIKERLQDLEDKIAKGMELAYERMLEFKKQKDFPEVFSKDGKIVIIHPEDL